MYWIRFAFRSCVRRRRRTVITLAGIGFGVAMLIVLGAIMVGVNDTMVENAVSLRAGHLVIRGGPRSVEAARSNAVRYADRAVAVSGITDAVARCSFPAVLRSDDAVLAVGVRLVDPVAEQRHSPVPTNITAGRWLTGPADTVIGMAAARELGVQVGDTVTVMTPDNEYPRTVSGLFRTGVDALDRGLVYLSLAAEPDLSESRVMVETAAFTKPGADLAVLRDRVAGQITGGRVETWRQRLPDVAQLVKLNEFAMNIMIVLVVAILGFGIANALLISVMDRYRYYAVLKALGVSPGSIVTTVLSEAAIMCLAAGLAGTLLGVLVVEVWGPVGLDIGRYTSFNPHFSVNAVIHPRLTMSMALLPELLALAVGVLAALWPATVAGFRTVVSGMRDL